MSSKFLRRSVVASTAVVLAGCNDGASDGATPGSTTTDAYVDDGGGASSGSATVATDGGTTTGGASSNPALGEVEQVGDLELSSPLFDDGGEIPGDFSRNGENVNPPLRVENVPARAESLAFVVDDPDAEPVAGHVWLHWLVWNVPASTTEIPRDWDGANAQEGVNDFGNRQYDGPAPPDGEHRYRFKCFALDGTLSVPVDASEERVGDAMRDRVVGATQLDGTYAP